MKVGLAQCVNKGMQRDYSMDKASQEFAYENKNIRITTNGENSFLSVTNEKSTELIFPFLTYEVEAEEVSLGLQLTFTCTNNSLKDEDYPEVTIDLETELGDVITFSFTGKEATYTNENLYINAIINKTSGIFFELIPYGGSLEIIQSIPPSIDGTILGTAIINDVIILFNHINETTDAIYKLKIQNKIYDVEELYKGPNLQFSLDNPIECITSYEADDVQKVYWVDGKNQPRVINICKTYDSSETFNFTPLISNKINVDIQKKHFGAGNFNSGVIQYYITFYNKYGAETNVAYQSPLYYISPEDRGGKIDESQSCSFEINITPSDDFNFEYLRVYSLVRTSKNAEPSVSIIGDIKVNGTNTVRLIDTNTNITPVAPTDIMFLGGNTIIASTIEQKDNTLFLGDIVSKREGVLGTIKEALELDKEEEGLHLEFRRKKVNQITSNNSLYKYIPNLDKSSLDVTTFKYLEWYRFGIQVQLETGEWSSTLFLKDLQNTIVPESSPSENDIVYNDSSEDGEWRYLTCIYFELGENLKNAIQENSINWRLTMAQHDSSTRTIKAQGLVLPTIFNLNERNNKRCFSEPLWTLGTCEYGKHFYNVDTAIFNGSPAYSPSEEITINPSPHNHLHPSVYFEDTDGEDYYTKLLYNVYANTENQTYDRGDGYYLYQLKVVFSVYRGFTSDNINISLSRDLFLSEVHLGLKKLESSNPKEIFWGKLKNTDCKYADTFPSEKYAYINISAYGQRKKQLNKMIEYLNNLLWQDCDSWEIYLENDTVIHPLDLVNYKPLDKVFKPSELPTGQELRDKIEYNGDFEEFYSQTFARDITLTVDALLLEKHKNNYFLDANICNFLSPDIDNFSNSLKLRLVGSTSINNSIADYALNVDNRVIGVTTYDYAKYDFNTYKSPITTSNATNKLTGIKSFPLWPYNNKMYYINYWHPSGMLIKDENITKEEFTLKTKKFANMWVCNDTTYLDNPNIIDYGLVADYAKIEENSDIAIINKGLYKGKYENLLVPKVNKNYKLPEGSEKSANETSPIESITEFILNTNFDREERNPSTVSIKYNTSKHGVFSFGNKFTDGSPLTLPNYYVPTGNGTVYGDIFDTSKITTSALFKIDGGDLLEDYDISFLNSIKNGNTYNIHNITRTGNSTNGYTLEFNYLLTPLLTISSDKYVEKEVIIQNFNGEEITTRELKRRLFTEGLVPTFDSIVFWFVFPRYEINHLLYFKVQAYPDSYVVKDFKILDLNTEFNFKYDGSIYTCEYAWDNIFKQKYESIIPPTVTTTDKIWIGEFYTDYDADSFMGGQGENALELNTFIPILGDYSEEEGWGLEGDTYLQRWDYLRTFPISETDVNQPKDAFSITVETYQNLDGDYRDLRGRTDTTNLTVENTNNTINEVYSQSNNYITSYILDDKHEDEAHPTMYTWSLNKQALSDVDNWTKINLSSSAKLDGDKGKLTKIKKWNNQLLAFQEKGIALINFNHQTTISSQEGVPVEIANSGKVTGHYYITTNQGCKNKWSIVESPFGIYFIDSYNKSINVFKEGIKSLTTNLLFEDWIRNNEKGIIWNPTNIENNGFKSFYDPIHKEVYFVNSDTALCYNELLEQFTSFYDYQNMNSMFNIDNHIYSIKDDNIYKMFEGSDYCNLYGKECDYYIIYKINKDSYIDKTWTSVEYKADIFDVNGSREDISSTDYKEMPKLVNETFDELEVWNEYQRGKSNLNEKKYPNARNKFRIWRADIPRDTEEGKPLNRIRNPWIMLKLTKTENTQNRMEFHDLIVKYLQ